MGLDRFSRGGRASATSVADGAPGAALCGGKGVWRSTKSGPVRLQAQSLHDRCGLSPEISRRSCCLRMAIRCCKPPPPASRLHCVGASRFKHVDGQEAQRALRVTIAKQGVWKIGPIPQGLAGPILSGIVAAIGGLGNAFDDIDCSPDGMPMKRSDATGWIGYLDHDKLSDIAGQWKTFENLAGDTGKPGLLGADGPVGRFSHGTFYCALAGCLDQIAVRINMARLRRVNKGSNANVDSAARRS